MRKLIIVMALAASALSAGTVTQTINFGPIIGTQNTNYTINKFDPALGSLTDISVTSTFDSTVQAQVFNAGGIDPSFDHAQVTFSLTVSTLFGTPETESASVTDSGYSGFAGPGVVYTHSPGTSGSKTLSGLVIPTSDFSIYQGTGTTSINIKITEGNATGNANSVAFSWGGTATSTGSTTVTYTYAATTPEPATISLLGSALFGLAVVARKRRKA